MTRRVLISGASIAGPALAYWLSRAGFEVVVVERAPYLRRGGAAVDFRGAAHFGVLQRMGDVLPRLKERATGAGAMRFVDERGRTRLYLPAEFAGGELEVPRADISEVFVAAATDRVEYCFGDSVSELRQASEHVETSFESGRVESFDFVFGADGIHSNIRRRAFGDKPFERFLGYYVAGWEIPNSSPMPRETVLCNLPGRMIGVTAPGIQNIQSALAVVAVNRQQAKIARANTRGILHESFGGMGWRAPEILAALDQTDDIFFSPMSRAIVPNWSIGRVALVGDAAGGVSIGGMGAGVAIVAAYVLATELIADPNDFAGAFARYQARVSPYAIACATNGQNSGRFLAPRTALALFLRNTVFSFPPIKAAIIRSAYEFSADIELPDGPPI